MTRLFADKIRLLPRSPSELARAVQVTPEVRTILPPTNLPEPASELVGRDDVLGEILSLASAHRLVTLTGAGGKRFVASLASALKL